MGEVDNNCSGVARRIYTVEQVAEMLGVSIRKAYSLCESTTDFKVIQLGARCIRVHKESFDLWLDAMSS